MAKGIAVRGMQVGLLAAVFATGFLVGSVTHPSAEAQLEEMGKSLGQEALKQAGESGGVLGSAAELGTTIVEMEQHVSGLQKNIDVLKKIKGALGG